MTHAIKNNEFIGLKPDTTVAEYMLLEHYNIDAKNIATSDIVNVCNLLMTIYNQRMGKNGPNIKNDK